MHIIVIVNPPRAEQLNVFEATAKLPTGILKDYGLGINSAIFPKNYIYPLTSSDQTRKTTAYCC